MSLLTIRNLVKHFATQRAVDDISFDITQGSIFGLLGPNGAGKTTLLRMINGIFYPDAGTIFFEGSPFVPQKHTERIGYMPEERGLYKSMKVGEQALYLARLKGLTKAQAKERLDYWFTKLGITHWWDKKIQELSKGMAQKVQFVITVLHRPKLLIFDEPFTGFDPVNADIIKNEILQLRDEGATILFSTHRMESVEELCEYIALIHQSNKLLDGKVSDIKRAYKSNTFEVGLSTTDDDRLLKELSDKFTVSKAGFKSITNDLKVRLQIGQEATSNDLLQYLISRAQVNHFVEVIPSVNDIFIKTVTSNA